MADKKIKEFFTGKKMDWKFRKAGEGHSLNEDKPKSSQSKPDTKGTAPPKSGATPTESSRSAGVAALARYENMGGKQSQAQKMKAAMAREMMREEMSSMDKTQHKMAGQQQQQDEPEHVEVEVSYKNITVHLVCPLCKKSVPNSAVMVHLAQCLQEELLKEPLTSSLHMVSTLCEDKDRRKACVDILIKYLDNVIAHPGEEKYRKIRLSNKAFQERVASVAGAMMFLEAVGFQQQCLPHQDSEEQFLVLPEEKAQEQEQLTVYRELLVSTQPLHCQVDRNVQVFRPSANVSKFDLPGDFFNLTVDDIKREQKLRSEQVEASRVLRTQVMRERDELKMAIRHYKFVVIRIRMPDGLVVQGIFRPLEKLSDVRTFISEALSDQTNIFCFSVLGKSFKDENVTLAALNMVPSAVLNLVWNNSSGPSPSPPYLLPDLMARIQEFQ